MQGFLLVLVSLGLPGNVYVYDVYDISTLKLMLHIVSHFFYFNNNSSYSSEASF